MKKKKLLIDIQIITGELIRISDTLLNIQGDIIAELEAEECTTSKKSEQEQTKNLPSFLKKPTSQEGKKEDN